MDNRDADDTKIANISDDYIRDLEPETQRYDITIAPDFVISVLPNGIKTWAFIYDFQGRHRRKTLGVFPDMNAAEAHAALKKSRDAIVRMDEPTIPPDESGMAPAVLGGGAYVPKHEPAGSRALMWTIIAIIAVVVAAAAWWFLIADHSSAADSPSRMDNSRPFTTTSNPSTTSAQKPDFVVGTNSPKKDANDTPPANTGERPDEPAVNNSAPAPEPQTTTFGATPPPERNNASSNSTSGTKISDTPPRTREVATTSSNSGAVTSTPRNTGSTSSSNSGNASLRGNSAPDASNSKPIEGPTAFGGRVARSRLTSGMDNLEPTDTLGPELTYKNSGVTRVFYFTELREFSDGKVMHQWELNGEVTDIVYLNVKKSWRWRTYSNKDITPGLTGEWKVSTIDATGTVLDTETFTYGYQ